LREILRRKEEEEGDTKSPLSLWERGSQTKGHAALTPALSQRERG
jgi:hypothetical protein